MPAMRGPPPPPPPPPGPPGRPPPPPPAPLPLPPRFLFTYSSEAADCTRIAPLTLSRNTEHRLHSELGAGTLPVLPALDTPPRRRSRRQGAGCETLALSPSAFSPGLPVDAPGGTPLETSSVADRLERWVACGHVPRRASGSCTIRTPASHHNPAPSATQSTLHPPTSARECSLTTPTSPASPPRYPGSLEDIAG